MLYVAIASETRCACDSNIYVRCVKCIWICLPLYLNLDIDIILRTTRRSLLIYDRKTFPLGWVYCVVHKQIKEAFKKVVAFFLANTLLLTDARCWQLTEWTKNITFLVNSMPTNKIHFINSRQRLYIYIFTLHFIAWQRPPNTHTHTLTPLGRNFPLSHALVVFNSFKSLGNCCVTVFGMQRQRNHSCQLNQEQKFLPTCRFSVRMEVEEAHGQNEVYARINGTKIKRLPGDGFLSASPFNLSTALLFFAVLCLCVTFSPSVSIKSVN